MENQLELNLRRALDQIINQECWGITAGEGTGTMAILSFGSKIPLSKEYKNEHLTEDLKKYEGEWQLFIECAWRISSETEVVCGCWEDNRKGGPMLSCLQHITNQKVESMDIHLPTWDLKIHFANSLTLSIFCDQTSLDEGFDNYSVSTLDDVYIVSTRSILRKESRDGE
jgi:hypothetical protein